MPFFQRRKKNVFQICLLYFVIICNNEISECNAAFLRYRFRESLQRLWSYSQGPDRMGIFGTKIDGPGLSGGPTSEGANKKGMTPGPPKTQDHLVAVVAAAAHQDFQNSQEQSHRIPVRLELKSLKRKKTIS